MFQLKFFLKTFQTCSLLDTSVLNVAFLAIILLKYLSLDPSAKGGGDKDGPRGEAKKIPVGGSCFPCPATSRAYDKV